MHAANVIVHVLIYRVMRQWGATHLFLACMRMGWYEGMSRVKSHGPSSAVAPLCPSFSAACNHNPNPKSHSLMTLDP